MDLNLANNITPYIVGAALPIITMAINNRLQVRRDLMKYDNDRRIETEKREFQEAKDNKVNMLQSIEKAYGLLSYFEHTISLTSSVIDSTNNLTSEEADAIYRKELKQLTSLKSIIIARFPDLYDDILKIDADHSNYWGNQRLLLKIDINTDYERYTTMQQIIITVVRKTNEDIYELREKFRNYSKTINHSAPRL